MSASTRGRVWELGTALVPGTTSAPLPLGELTSPELLVLRSTARGMAAKPIAGEPGTGPKMIEFHTAKIFTTLGVPNQTAAVGLATASGLLGGD